MASKEAEEVEEVEKTDIGSGSSSSAMVGENTDIVKKHIETKIAIFNLPKHWNKRTMRNFVKDKNIEHVRSCRKVPNTRLGFVSFDTVENMRKGMEKFKSLRIPRGDGNNKRKHDEISDDDGEFFKCNISREKKKSNNNNKKRKKNEEEKIKATCAVEAVAPLYNVPYEKQIEDKFKESYKNVMTITKRVRRKFVRPCKLDETLIWNGWTTCKENAGNLCPTEKVQTCSKINGYRNKCTFSFGNDKDGKICAGFRIGNFVDTVKIDSPDNCPNIADVCKLVARLATNFVSTTSKLKVYNTVNRTGFWYQLTTRHSERTNELMIMILAKPVEDKDLVNSEIEQFCEYFRNSEELGKFDVKLVSLWISTFEGTGNIASNSNVDTKHLWGKKCIEEKLLGRTFEISPMSFFQVNTMGAEVLYSVVRDCVKACKSSNENELTVVLDICCGTGTIGICMSDIADLVIGVEICEPAVEDAKRNAELNNVKNARFVCRAAEKELRGLLHKGRIRQVAMQIRPELFEKDGNRPIRVIAIVDPPRAGLHMKAIRALRKCIKIEKLIYVSCNPSGSLVDNAIELCRPEVLNQKDQRTYIKGPHFDLTHAYPVDMFPHTKHCEMVMMFERGDSSGVKQVSEADNTTAVVEEVSTT